MNPEGTVIWEKVTTENISKRVALVLDETVFSAPVIQGKIPNGHAYISGKYELEELLLFSIIINSGPLCTPMEIKSIIIE